MDHGTETLKLVASGCGYELLASADEAAFLLRYKTDRLSAKLEGDDATPIRADYETIKQQHPSREADQSLSQLWDQGGYSWRAAQETS